MRSSPTLSIVIPVYNEEAVLEQLFARLYPALDALRTSYEVIFVNDGSRDQSVPMLRAQFERRPKETRCVLLLTNFGQHAAILAGLEQARGEYIKAMPDIEGFAASALAQAQAHAAAGAGGASAEAKKQTDRGGGTAAKSAPGTAAGPGAGGQPAADGGAAPDESEEAAKALKKEEDDFLKIEAAFIAELGLAWEALPEPIKAAHPPPKEETKK